MNAMPFPVNVEMVGEIGSEVCDDGFTDDCVPATQIAPHSEVVQPVVTVIDAKNLKLAMTETQMMAMPAPMNVSILDAATESFMPPRRL